MDDNEEGLRELLVLLRNQVQTNNLYGQGTTLRDLGHLTKSLGYLMDSCEFYVSACHCFRDVEDHYAEAAVLLDLAQTLESLGHQDIAIEISVETNRIFKAAAKDKAVSHASY